jgi:hypothetical protein
MRKLSAGFLRVAGFFIITTALTLNAFGQDSSGEEKETLTNPNLRLLGRPDLRISGRQVNPPDNKNELSVWGGFAPDIPRVFGGSRRSTFGEVGVRYSRRIATTENLALKYQVDFIPLAILNYRTERLIQPTPTTLDYTRDRETAYGIGLTPVNFQLNFRRKTKVQPFVTAEAGMLFFNKAIPDDRSPLRPNQVGRRFNFILAGGGGVEFLTDDARSYTVGFKFHHISNNSSAKHQSGIRPESFLFRLHVQEILSESYRHDSSRLFIDRFFKNLETNRRFFILIYKQNG